MSLPEYDHYVTVGKKADGKYYGLVFNWVKCPDGQFRWCLGSITREGFFSSEEAAEHINAYRPAGPPGMNISMMQAVSGKEVPDLSPGTVVEVRLYNPRSRNPDPRSQFPEIYVQGYSIDAPTLARMIQGHLLELEFENFDPELSCGYAYFRVPVMEGQKDGIARSSI